MCLLWSTLALLFLFVVVCFRELELGVAWIDRESGAHLHVSEVRSKQPMTMKLLF